MRCIACKRTKGLKAIKTVGCAEYRPSKTLTGEWICHNHAVYGIPIKDWKSTTKYWRKKK